MSINERNDIESQITDFKPAKAGLKQKCRNCGHMSDPFLYLSKSLSVGWKKSYHGGNFFMGVGVTGEQNPYNEGWRHSKYRSHMLINGCDKKMKLIGRKPKYR